MGNQEVFLLQLFYHASFSVGFQKKILFGGFSKHKFTTNKLMFSVSVTSKC